MTTLLTAISQLATQDDELGEISDAALVLDGELIVWVGRAADAPDADVRVDLGGRAVIPGFVDSHAHLVFAGDRAAEFAARMTRSSGSPKLTPRKGAAIPSKIATTGTAVSTGLRMTNAASWLQNPDVATTTDRRRPTRNRFTRGPKTRKTAGRVISAPAAATATTAIPA